MRYPKAFAVITGITIILCYMSKAELQKGTTVIAYIAVAGIIYKIYSKIRYTNECMKIHKHNLDEIKEKNEDKEEWKWF